MNHTVAKHFNKAHPKTQMVAPTLNLLHVTAPCIRDSSISHFDFQKIQLFHHGDSY